MTPTERNWFPGKCSRCSGADTDGHKCEPSLAQQFTDPEEPQQ